MSIKSLRISKTSIKEWDLHGPIDQALKTSMQANSVKVYPIDMTLHGEPFKVELWVNADPINEVKDAPNPYAMVMVQAQKAREDSSTPCPTTSVELGGEVISMTTLSMADLVPIAGPAILTGAGGTDAPQHNVACIFSALMGNG